MLSQPASQDCIRIGQHNAHLDAGHGIQLRGLCRCRSLLHGLQGCLPARTLCTLLRDLHRGKGPLGSTHGRRQPLKLVKQEDNMPYSRITRGMRLYGSTCSLLLRLGMTPLAFTSFGAGDHAAGRGGHHHPIATCTCAQSSATGVHSASLVMALSWTVYGVDPSAAVSRQRMWTVLRSREQLWTVFGVHFSAAVSR